MTRPVGFLLVRASPSLHRTARTCCIDRRSLPLWNASALPALSYSVLLARDAEVRCCVEAIRTDARFAFHVHYIINLDLCREETPDTRLASIGNLKLWRPGDTPPSRAGDPTRGIPPMPDGYAPDFEVHILPYDASEVVSSSVAQGLRQTSVQCKRIPPHI